MIFKPDTQGCWHISWLLSEILFRRPIMNKKKINHIKILEATLYVGSINPYFFHIRLPVVGIPKQ